MSPGAESTTSMSNAVGKADRTGYHLKALQEIRNSLRPFATENGGGSPSPTLPKDGPCLGSYQAHLYHPYSPSNGYIEVMVCHPILFSSPAVLLAPSTPSFLSHEALVVVEFFGAHHLPTAGKL